MLTGRAPVADGGVVATALVPGMPQLLAGQPAPSWEDLRTGVQEVGERFRSAGVQTVIVLSTQWFTVLGHQFQLDPNPRGQRTDENWYAFDYGHLAYDLRIDAPLTERWLDLTADAGLQTRRTHYEGFPIDTGTVVAANLLDPGRLFHTALVSCNLYAEVDALATIGSAAAAASERVGRRVGVIAISGLSAGLVQRWISPDEDAIAEPGHDKWNRAVLEALVRGDVDGALQMRERFAREARADSQFRALAFLAGTGQIAQPAEMLAYGPIWGTGAAVVFWPALTTRKAR